MTKFVPSCNERNPCSFIGLNYDEYTQSVFEQFSDFIYHKKNTKYLTRISLAFKNMNDIAKPIEALQELSIEIDKLNKSPIVLEELILKLAACIIVLLEKVTDELEGIWGMYRVSN